MTPLLGEISQGHGTTSLVECLFHASGRRLGVSGRYPGRLEWAATSFYGWRASRLPSSLFCIYSGSCISSPRRAARRGAGTRYPLALHREVYVHDIIYLVGLVVVVMFILGALGLH